MNPRRLTNFLQDSTLTQNTTSLLLVARNFLFPLLVWESEPLIEEYLISLSFKFFCRLERLFKIQWRIVCLWPQFALRSDLAVPGSTPLYAEMLWTFLSSSCRTFLIV